MAQGIIKQATTSGSATVNGGQGANCYCHWEKIGKIVTVSGVLSHQIASWSIFLNLPIPDISATTDNGGAIIGRLTSGIDIYITNEGSLQTRTANTFSNYYNFSGAYVSK